MVEVVANAELFDGEQMRGRCDVSIEDGRIVEIAPARQEALSGDGVHNLRGMLLAPGFIDVQVNGGGGALFNNDPSVEALETMAAAHRNYGTTTLIPTVITDTNEVLDAAAEAVSTALAGGLPGIRGIHFEGPCLNPERKGVHKESNFRSLDDDLMEIYTRDGLGAVVVTLAPERVELGRIRELANQGVFVCAGHTAADYQTVSEAIGHGMRGFTHLYNAMSPMTNREPGVVGAALDDGFTWCGLIVDGYHLHDATARNAIRSKARGKMMLVTDAMSTVGAREKKFSLYGEEIHAEDGRLARTDGTLAGSDLDMMSAVRNTHMRLGVALDEALRMASLYPAQFLKLDGTIGKVKAGFAADLVAIDPADLSVKSTWIGGEMREARS